MKHPANVLDDRHWLLFHSMGQIYTFEVKKLMYDKVYVKKKARRRAAAVVAAISAMGITSLAIVAFLGRYTGTFTISLKNQEVALTLSERSDFTNTTSFLRLSAVPQFDEYQFSRVLEKQPDNEELDYTYGASHYDSKGNIDAYNFLKYTFFVKNVGTSFAGYDLKVKLTDDQVADPTRAGSIYISDLIRVMIYENDSDDEHNYEVYAKPKGSDEDTVHVTKTGEVTNQEFISQRPNSATMVETDEYPLAKNFYDNSTAVKYTGKTLDKGQFRRYTIVTWLEGYDPQSSAQHLAPIGASIKLGVEITAYEN